MAGTGPPTSSKTSAPTSTLAPFGSMRETPLFCGPDQMRRQSEGGRLGPMAAPLSQGRGLVLPSTPSATRHQVAPRRRPVHPSVVVIVGYLLIGIVAFWPVYPGIFSQHPLQLGTGLHLSVWFLDWVPHALAHGLNPFFSNAIYVPTGVNLAQNTESPLLGLITAPFAPVLSPVVRTNLLMVLSMPVSATAAFVVLRKWDVWGPRPLSGG